MNILCFGDSNTYGYRPDGIGRFDENTRWTALLQKALGDGHRVIKEGLCGRTTVFQDEIREGRRGLDLIGVAVESHNPVDLVIVMLGTNDCKTRYGASAGTIAKGLEQVVAKAYEKAAQPFELLIISPIHLASGVGEEGYDPEFDEHSVEVSKQLAAAYQTVAVRYGAGFLRASDYAKPSVTDREHLDEVGHAALADAVLQFTRKLDTRCVNSTEAIAS